MVKARTDVVQREVEKRGWTVLQLTVELGLGSVNTAQALLGGEAVGSKTIARALRVFAPLTFEELFVTEDAPSQQGGDKRKAVA